MKYQSCGKRNQRKHLKKTFRHLMGPEQARHKTLQVWRWWWWWRCLKYTDLIHTEVILLVSCEYETWSLNTDEEHRLRVYENTVLREISGPKRGAGRSDSKKLNNEELQHLFCLLSTNRVTKWRRVRRYSMGHARKGNGIQHFGGETWKTYMQVGEYYYNHY